MAKIKIVEFRKEHMRELLTEDHNKCFQSLLDDEKNLTHHENSGLCYSILSETNKVLFCGGVSLFWKDRGEAWVLFTKDVTNYFLEIHRAISRYLKIVQVRRIEATVVCGFEAGHRWMRLFGFTLEAPILKYHQPDGSDVSLYARIAK